MEKMNAGTQKYGLAVMAEMRQFFPISLQKVPLNYNDLRVSINTVRSCHGIVAQP